MTDNHIESDNATKLFKIRALLDKAESTAAEFPDEAEALTAKAIEMMERYRIDEAMVADAAPIQDRGKIIERTISVGSGPYVNARIDLAENIARNHSVVLLQSTGYQGKVIYLNGYETDVDITEMLYTSLLVQATRLMSSPQTKETKPYHVHGTAFNRSFLIGFATRIGERLKEASSAAEGTTASSERSVALVLVDRRNDVENFVFSRYGKLRSARGSSARASWSGIMAGNTAANSADIGTNRRMPKSKTMALSA